MGVTGENATDNLHCGILTFSTHKFGNDEAFRLACEYRIEMVAELNRQGAGYTKTHGIRVSH